jgi:hypothetical protein
MTIPRLCQRGHDLNDPAVGVPVTCRENILRGVGFAATNAVKTHCPAGHPLDGANLYVCPRGTRKCRACRAEASRRYLQRKRAAA